MFSRHCNRDNKVDGVFKNTQWIKSPNFHASIEQQTVFSRMFTKLPPLIHLKSYAFQIEPAYSNGTSITNLPFFAIRGPKYFTALKRSVRYSSTFEAKIRSKFLGPKTAYEIQQKKDHRSQYLHQELIKMGSYLCHQKSSTLRLPIKSHCLKMPKSSFTLWIQ